MLRALCAAKPSAIRLPPAHSYLGSGRQADGARQRAAAPAAAAATAAGRYVR